MLSSNYFHISHPSVLPLHHKGPLKDPEYARTFLYLQCVIVKSPCRSLPMSLLHVVARQCLCCCMSPVWKGFELVSANPLSEACVTF